MFTSLNSGFFLMVDGFNLLNINAMRGEMFLPRSVEQSVHQTGFANLAFPNKDELGFINRGYWSCTQVELDSVNTLFIRLSEFRTERIAVKCKLFQLT